MTFILRKIDVTFQLAQGSFAESGQDTTKLSGLRTSCHVENAGGRGFGMLELRVYGMTPSMMNQLSTLGMRIALVPRNTVTVEAGDDDSGMSIVFTGTIYRAYTDFEDAPNTPFIVMAQAALFESVMPFAPTSKQGTSDVATVLSGLADALGWGFENSGVKTKIENVYLYGSPRTQIQQIVTHAKINWTIDFNKAHNVLAIWPKDGHRDGQVPQISPDTGMIGYPEFTAEGLLLRTLFNPNLQLGGQVEVKSSLKGATGNFTIFWINYDLEANLPGGKWECELGAYKTSTKATLGAPVNI